MKMSEDIKHIRATLDKMDDKQDAMQLVLAKNTVILDEHIRRTDLLEGKVDVVEDTVKGALSVKRFVTWALGIATGLVGLAYGISKLLT